MARLLFRNHLKNSTKIGGYIMKSRFLLLTLILPLMIYGQKSKPIDDIYFAPSDARQVLDNNAKRNYKNNAR